MSMLVRGDHLGSYLRQQVLTQFVHRWTHENAKQSYQGDCPACRQVGFPAKRIYTCGEALPDGPYHYTQEQWHAYHVPLISDEEWLKAHAFYVTKKGELDARRRHAEPACLA